MIDDATLICLEGVLRDAIRHGQEECPVDPVFVAEVISELRRLRSGEAVVVPRTVKHAEAMHLLAERYLRDNRRRGTMDIAKHVDTAMRMLAKCTTDTDRRETLWAVIDLVAKEADVEAARQAMVIVAGTDQHAAEVYGGSRE